VLRIVRFRRPVIDAGASDEALVTLALHDRQVFGLLYDRYVDPIYRYCYGRLDQREDAEDATTLIFTRALAALPTQRGVSFRSWLFAIAHNVVLNARRDGVSNQSLDAALEVLDPSPTIEDLAAAADRRHSVNQALWLLPEEQRRVVELRLAGLTGPEVATTLGRSHDSIRTTQRRALARLRVLLSVTPEASEGRHAS
jgi:RNA polymerase sigma-70 factor, ECF subfamily